MIRARFHAFNQIAKKFKSRDPKNVIKRMYFKKFWLLKFNGKRLFIK